MVAAFLVLRLRSVLGRRTGHERPPTDPYAAKSKPKAEPADNSDRVVALPPRGDRAKAAAAQRAQSADPLEAGITQIRIADSDFDPDQFVQGAKSAFEMIVTSYASGDRDTLRPLLSDEVYENFGQAIDERAKNKHTLETTLVAVRSADLLEASMDGRVAFLSVKFVTEQINVTRDEQGEVVDGDTSQVATVTDIWTFARNTRSRNPNWTLVATEAPN